MNALIPAYIATALICTAQWARASEPFCAQLEALSAANPQPLTCAGPEDASGVSDVVCADAPNSMAAYLLAAGCCETVLFDGGSDAAISVACEDDYSAQSYDDN